MSESNVRVDIATRNLINQPGPSVIIPIWQRRQAKLLAHYRFSAVSKWQNKLHIDHICSFAPPDNTQYTDIFWTPRGEKLHIFPLVDKRLESYHQSRLAGGSRPGGAEYIFVTTFDSVNRTRALVERSSTALQSWQCDNSFPIPSHLLSPFCPEIVGLPV